MTKFLTAEEATGLLKIRRQTLYAYVSRGLIRSNGQDGDPHRRLYRADDVEALLGRKRRGRTPARAAQTALDWGLPVLESVLTLVEDGRLYYCGQDAVTLARGGAALEDVARLMWGAVGADPFAADQPQVDPLWREWMPRCAAQSAVSRCLTMLPLAAPVDVLLRIQTAPGIGGIGVRSDQAAADIGVERGHANAQPLRGLVRGQHTLILRQY